VDLQQAYFHRLRVNLLPNLSALSQLSADLAALKQALGVP